MNCQSYGATKPRQEAPALLSLAPGQLRDSGMCAGFSGSKDCEGLLTFRLVQGNGWHCGWCVLQEAGGPTTLAWPSDGRFREGLKDASWRA